MSFPPLPPYTPAASAPDPGAIPLRPLSAGDVIGAGFGVVRRHLALLGPVAIVISVLSAAAEIAILAGTHTLDSFASGDWIDEWSRDFSSGKVDSLPMGIYAAVGASSLISIAGAFILSGLAAACAGVDAVQRTRRGGLVAERLRGRIGILIAVSVVVAVVSLAGSLVFVIPGLIVYSAWAMAAPAAVLERGSVAGALSRSTRLTRGRRWRVLGMTLLIVVITAVIDAVISSAVVAAVTHLSPVAGLVVSSAVGAVVAAVTSSWIGAVIALLYVDARLRSENLGPTLRAFAATLPRS